jgi:undecaprenyl pyrophosphate phosphatase UppP
MLAGDLVRIIKLELIQTPHIGLHHALIVGANQSMAVVPGQKKRHKNA